MALENKNSAIYLSIGNGKLCRTFNAPTEGSIERVNKNNKVVHEIFYDQLTGNITSIKTRDHAEYSKSWLVTIEDEGVNYVLQIKYSSGYAASFLKTLPNVDLSKHVTIIPKLTKEGDKSKATLFITQGGVPLKHYYTKDHPNGLPQLEQKKVKGKITWDDSEMMEFLENMVNNTIVPKLSGSSVDTGAEAVNETAGDNMPF